jgi:hypothetical protein
MSISDPVVFSLNSSRRASRKSRTKEELQASIRAAKRELKLLAEQEREASIRRLGTLALRHGLDAYDDAAIEFVLQDVLQRLLDRANTTN